MVMNALQGKCLWAPMDLGVMEKTAWDPGHFPTFSDLPGCHWRDGSFTLHAGAQGFMPVFRLLYAVSCSYLWVENLEPFGP